MFSFKRNWSYVIVQYIKKIVNKNSHCSYRSAWVAEHAHCTLAGRRLQGSITYQLIFKHRDKTLASSQEAKQKKNSPSIVQNQAACSKKGRTSRLPRQGTEFWRCVSFWNLKIERATNLLFTLEFRTRTFNAHDSRLFFVCIFCVARGARPRSVLRRSDWT